MVEFNDKLYFKGYDTTNYHYGIMSYDGVNEPVMEAYFSTNQGASQAFNLGDSALY